MLAFAGSSSKSMKASSTVIDLTVNDAVEIDLTTIADSPPLSPRPNGINGEPPRKRQRVSDRPFLPSKSRDLAACLKAQVKPYIDASLAEIPAGTVNSYEIGRRVVNDIGSTPQFSLEFTHNGGFLSQGLEKELADRARDLVAHYRWQHEYQITATPTYSPAPPSQRELSTSAATPVIPSASPPRRTSIAPARLPSTTPRPLAPAATIPQTKSRPHVEEFPSAPVSSTNYRTKARAKSFKSWHTHASRSAPATASRKAKAAWMNMPRRPYITTEERKTIFRGTSKLVRTKAAAAALSPFPFHVDFTPDEMEVLRRKVRALCDKKPKTKRSSDTAREMGKLLRKRPELLTIIPPELELRGALAQRDQVAIRNLLDELVDRHKRPARQPKVLTLEVDESDKQGDAQRTSQIPSLLFAREIDGNRGFGRMRRQVNFSNEFRKAHEDDLEMRAEWVGCAGDIMTIVWTSDTNFICGATAHSDSHNQQYNKAGNLLLCSTTRGQLKAYPDHRIPRPIVEKGENSTEAMRESQSPWLYSSVVSSDYDQINDRAYTSSFDKTVKVWKVDKTGGNMTVLGTWAHQGNVNFVAVSKLESGMVATAADVASHAVRVYNVDSSNISSSPYKTYSGARAWNEGNEQTTATQKWAYFPATMQWGLANEVQHMLLVGYSPRSLTGDDNDIPDEKRNTGEICLWNCLTGEKIKVLTASTQNVFEVVWHPTLPSFLVATSPAGLMVDDNTMTQIRVFRPSLTPEGDTAFGEIQCLDCPARDINELTVRPNSAIYSYVTAACTDGKVYVWDTARGDKPIHVLRHKKPIDEFSGDREEADVGVKFTAWGTTPDRFYTGGSDGVVKVWNVRNSRHPLVRDLLEAPGAIACGAFSSCFSRLAVGDATGRVMLLSLNEKDEPPAKYVMPPIPPGGRTARPVRRPMPIIEHEEPLAPYLDDEPHTGAERGRMLLASGQLVRHRDPTVGVIQGPEYSTLGLHRSELHFEGNPSQPLLAKVEWEQQENQKMFRRKSLKVSRYRPLQNMLSAACEVRHKENMAKDLDLQGLDEMTKIDLLMDQVCIDDPIHDQGWDFEYEEEVDYEKSAWAALSG
ncbi:RING assembly protein 3 [Colletotrichum spaethianum]|uniref:RING assembly protein 3 n=1 Tax=Colletotrichum spaethianum TaxID=700344 RepID=A0AA37UTH1_9PEZI|nr:RING assembly protein 3 [Colletotrichum spaethianum]GKT51918.1 RING assembly protein 3 [Colletotrichum spaethianum]